MLRENLRRIAGSVLISTLVACGPNETQNDGGTNLPPPLPENCIGERSLEDRPDDSTLAQVRAIYVLPSDSQDQERDIDGRICSSIAGMQQWFDSRTNGKHLRFDTFGGKLDIGFIRLSKTDAQMHGTNTSGDLQTDLRLVRNRIQWELEQLGTVTRPNKMQLAFYGGTASTACGGGAYPPLMPGWLAAVYVRAILPGNTQCEALGWGNRNLQPAYLDFATHHELLHTMGFVAMSAPNHIAGQPGHVFDATTPQLDLMYTPPTASDPDWGVLNPNGMQLDIGRNDYYGHGRSDVLDLAKSAFLEPLPATAEMPPSWPL